MYLWNIISFVDKILKIDQMFKLIGNTPLLYRNQSKYIYMYMYSQFTWDQY